MLAKADPPLKKLNDGHVKSDGDVTKTSGESTQSNVNQRLPTQLDSIFDKLNLGP